MTGYEKHQINYLSVMHYPDGNAGIGWHKHDEDNGCDTPVLLKISKERQNCSERSQMPIPPKRN